MKRAIVTGSEGQLGKVFTKHLVKLNYNVIGFDVVESSDDNNIDYYKVDISSKNQIESCLDNIDNDIDLLINNAGVSVFSPFEDRTELELEQVIKVNLIGTILMTQAVYNRFFKNQKSGVVVNIGSIYGVISGDMKIYNEGDRRTPEIYGATKAAVINLTKYFAAYMAPNIRVNCISPGGIFNNQQSDFIQKYSLKVPKG